MTWLEIVRAVGRACLTRAGLALLALLASIAGAAVLTGMLLWSMLTLERAERWDAIANIAYGLLGTVAMVILSLGLVISQRSLEAEFWKVKFKAQSGDDE